MLGEAVGVAEAVVLLATVGVAVSVASSVGVTVAVDIKVAVAKVVLVAVGGVLVTSGWGGVGVGVRVGQKSASTIVGMSGSSNVSG